MIYPYEYYNDFLKNILDRWTRETERSIWAGHYESEKDKIDLCFDIANNKARQVYFMDSQLDEKSVLDEPKPVVESPIQDEPVPIKDEPIKKREILKENGSPNFAPSTLIITIGISSHLHNILHKHNINTVGELTSLKQSQIEKILTYNNQHLLELIFELNNLRISHNFSLSQAIKDEITYTNNLLPHPFSTPYFEPELHTEEEEEAVEDEDEEENKPDLMYDKMRIIDFEFPPRIQSRFKVARIYTMKDLLSKSTGDLLCIPAFGRGLLAQVIQELDNYGIKHSFNAS